MDRVDTTFNALFPIDFRARARALADRREPISTHALGATLAVNGLVVFGQIAQKSAGLLQFSPLDLMLATWTKWRELREYADPKRHSPNEVFVIALAEHSITSEHRPYLDIVVGTHPVARIDFAASIGLDLEALDLKIQAGRIKAVAPGACKVRMNFACKDIELIKSKRTLLQPPDLIDLGEGIPIAPPDSVAA
jgi:hypothetical protein